MAELVYDRGFFLTKGLWGRFTGAIYSIKKGEQS